MGERGNASLGEWGRRKWEFSCPFVTAKPFRVCRGGKSRRLRWRKPHGETLVSSREKASDTIIASAICRRDSFRGRAFRRNKTSRTSCTLREVHHSPSPFPVPPKKTAQGVEKVRQRKMMERMRKKIFFPSILPGRLTALVMPYGRRAQAARAP